LRLEKRVAEKEVAGPKHLHIVLTIIFRVTYKLLSQKHMLHGKGANQ
jgi:hypothetical protein